MRRVLVIVVVTLVAAATSGSLSRATPGARATYGFFLPDVDYSPAIGAVMARHPAVEWSSDFPRRGSDADLRAARNDLLVAKARVNRAATRRVADALARRNASDVFASRLMPLVVAETDAATAAAVTRNHLARNDEVLAVRRGGELRPAMASAYADAQMGEPWRSGHDGGGTRLAIVEYGKVDFSIPGLASADRRLLYATAAADEPCAEGVAPNAPTSYVRHLNKHMTRAAAILVGGSEAEPQRGFAPGATLVVASANVDDGTTALADRRVIAAAECAVIEGEADVISLSLSQNIEHSVAEAFFDYLVDEHRVVVVAPSGNRNPPPGSCPDEVVASPSSGWNVLSVGGIRDGGDVVGDHSNNARWYVTVDGKATVAYCWRAPPAMPTDVVNDRIKPDLLAVASHVSSAGYAGHSGTSFAAPMVAGTAATLVGRDKSLRAAPETVRAIILAATRANRTVAPGGPLPNVDEEGAGTLSAKWAHALMSGAAEGLPRVGGYGQETLLGWAPFGGCRSGRQLDIPFATDAGRSVRFLITWNSHAGPATAGMSDVRYADFDLDVIAPDGRPVTPDATSMHRLVASNTEWVDFAAPVEGRYIARITPARWGCAIERERIGWAWVAPPER